MESKVIKYLVKNGNNEEEATKAVRENLETAMAILSGGTPAKLAEVILTIR